MRGFAATPVVFIAMFLIMATLFLQFLSMDKQVAAGITKEGELSKSSADVMKIENENNTAIYLKTKEYQETYNNDADKIKIQLEAYFNPIKFTAVNGTNWISVTYTLNTTANNLNKIQTYSQNITR